MFLLQKQKTKEILNLILIEGIIYINFSVNMNAVDCYNFD